MTTTTRVYPRFIVSPDTASQTNYYKQTSGDDLTTDATVNISSGRFDFMREARWHRLQWTFTGDWEMSGFAPEWEVGGDE
jgi:hypothetical protein